MARGAPHSVPVPFLQWPPDWTPVPGKFCPPGGRGEAGEKQGNFGERALRPGGVLIVKQ